MVFVSSVGYDHAPWSWESFHDRETIMSTAKTASLRDVADRAGVSVATASRVASGSAAVRPETRERVERAMRDLLYVPPGRTEPSGAIGLLMPEFGNPVFAGAGAGDGDAGDGGGFRDDHLQHRRLRDARGRTTSTCSSNAASRGWSSSARDHRRPQRALALRRSCSSRARASCSSTAPPSHSPSRRSASTSARRGGSRPSTCSSSDTAGSASWPAETFALATREKGARPAGGARRPRYRRPRYVAYDGFSVDGGRRALRRILEGRTATARPPSSARTT